MKKWDRYTDVASYDVAICCGRAAGIAAAMADDFCALDVKDLQAVLKNGAVLHEREIMS